MKNKNVHVLSTSQPSRLSDCHDNKLYLDDVRYLRSYQNIYITNDEEIKDGDYITDGYKVWQWKDDSSLLGRKKVILTTDQDLIKDGIQTIDDEFLEWFVKNPSCEEVDFIKIVGGNSIGNLLGTYEIIIPKEELSTKLHIGEVVDESYPKEFKQETLEEDELKIILKEATNQTTCASERMGFILGAKWQAEQLSTDDAIQTLKKGIALLLKRQEKMFSKEEVMEMFHKLSMHLPLHYEMLVREMFKNK